MRVFAQPLAGFAALLGVVAMNVVACGGDSNGLPQAAGPAEIVIIDFGFEPDVLTASAGQQLSLNIQNGGNAAHTFTIDGLVDSGRLEGGSLLIRNLLLTNPQTPTQHASDDDCDRR